MGWPGILLTPWPIGKIFPFPLSFKAIASNIHSPNWPIHKPVSGKPSAGHDLIGHEILWISHRSNPMQLLGDDMGVYLVIKLSHAIRSCLGSIPDVPLSMYVDFAGPDWLYDLVNVTESSTLAVPESWSPDVSGSRVPLLPGPCYIPRTVSQRTPNSLMWMAWIYSRISEICTVTISGACHNSSLHQGKAISDISDNIRAGESCG